jgi:hypothetical protein
MLKIAITRTGHAAFIRKWLSKHPEVESYVVVDDHASEHAGLPLFKCKTDVGLTPELVEDIVDYFEVAARPRTSSCAAASTRTGIDDP